MSRKRFNDAHRKKQFNLALKIACELGLTTEVTDLLSNPNYLGKVNVNHISRHDETALDVVNRAPLDVMKKNEIIAILNKYSALTAKAVLAAAEKVNQLGLSSKPETIVAQI